MARLSWLSAGVLAALLFAGAGSAQQQPGLAAPGPLQIQHGQFPLGGDLAKVDTGSRFGFLSGAEAERLLVDIWGNPKEAATGVLGVLVPENFDASGGPNSWAVIITYQDMGHVDDDDAADVDADELMETLQAQQVSENEERKRLGYGAITVVGWARPPSYDATQKKAIWAEHLRFETAASDTLNYNIRVLGRSGVLVLNAVADMAQLHQIETAEPGILAAASFAPGNTYADFDAETDKVASVGIAGLIAGGLAVAAKGGLLKGLIAFLAVGWKFVALAAVAVLGFIARMWRGRTTPPGA